MPRISIGLSSLKQPVLILLSLETDAALDKVHIDKEGKASVSIWYQPYHTPVLFLSVSLSYMLDRRYLLTERKSGLIRFQMTFHSILVCFVVGHHSALAIFTRMECNGIDKTNIGKVVRYLWYRGMLCLSYLLSSGTTVVTPSILK